MINKNLLIITERDLTDRARLDYEYYGLDIFKTALFDFSYFNDIKKEMFSKSYTIIFIDDVGSHCLIKYNRDPEIIKDALDQFITTILDTIKPNDVGALIAKSDDAISNMEKSMSSESIVRSDLIYDELVKDVIGTGEMNGSN